jgi:hypothetical protein
MGSSSKTPFLLKKEVARGGERTRVLLVSFIFSFFTTLPLSHSGSPQLKLLTEYRSDRETVNVCQPRKMFIMVMWTR